MRFSVQPDLILVNPSNRRLIYQDLADRLSAVEPPVWAGLLASYVRNKGYGVEIYDANAEETSPYEAARIIVDAKPRFVTIVVYGHNPSASTQIMPAARELCEEIKRIKPDQPVLFLGGHVAALPERTMSDERADFACSGEGFNTLTELIDALKAGTHRFDDVSDLVYRDESRVVSSSKRAHLVTDLEKEVPGIAWDLLPMDKYRAHNWHCFGSVEEGGELSRTPYAALYTTLGCPFRCTFCCIQAPFKSGEKANGLSASVNSYRSWSPARVLDELELLQTRYGVKNVKIADEMFVLKRSHVEPICDGIIERGLDLNMWAYARVDTVKSDLLPKLKKAGFNWLAFGVESANEAVRGDVQKGIGETHIRDTIGRVSAEGIFVAANYIFGLPEDNYDTMRQTLDLALDLNSEWANFYSAMAYPGSKLFNLAVSEGWKLPADWSGFSQHSTTTLPLPTRHLSGSEVLRFRDEAFNTYFTNPRYLELVEARFGSDTLRHVCEMTGHVLERAYA